MKTLLLFSCMAIWALPGYSQVKENELKIYYLVILTKGPNRTQDSASVAKIQKAHLQHIDDMHAQGKLDIAGPFAEDGDWRGVFILNVAGEAEAKELVASDPAVRSGRLSYIIKPWYSAPKSCLR